MSLGTTHSEQTNFKAPRPTVYALLPDRNKCYYFGEGLQLPSFRKLSIGKKKKNVYVYVQKII